MMDKVKDDLDVDMNYTNPGDHESASERNNRTLQEWFRTAFHITGYATMPKIMIETLITLTCNRLNMFPGKSGISSYYSPSILMKKPRLDYNRQCKYEFGEYVQADVETQNNTREQK